MTHPLMEIQFVFTDPIAPPEIVIRHWYHVPRIGEHVQLSRMTNTELEHLSGKVAGVMWDDNMVVVQLV